MKIIRKTAFFAALAGLLALVSACGPSRRDEVERSSGTDSPDPQVILVNQLAEIASRYPDARSAPSGLRFIQIKTGEGESTPRAGDTATVHYTGRLLDGRVFDSSRNRGRPFTFQVGLGQVIRGWESVSGHAERRKADAYHPF